MLPALVLALASPPRAAAATPVAPPGFFGVDINAGPINYPQMAAADIGVTRTVFPLGLIKQGPTTPYYWGYSDEIIGDSAENGIKVIPSVYGSPLWISTKLNKTPLKGEAKQVWAAYLTALVDRYGPDGGFWAENPYVHWNRNLMALAHSKGLDVWRTARLFAVVHTAASDAIIAGCSATRSTVSDAPWSPLVAVNDPDGSCGHGCWAAAVIASVAACFGGLRLEWTLTTSKAAVPALMETERTYRHLIELLAEIGNACVCSGCQCRHALRDAAVIGGRVAAHVQWHHFQQTR